MIAFGRTFILGAVASAALALAACASLQVHSFAARPSTPPKQYTTYSWANDDPQPTGDPRLDSNPFFERRLMTSAEEQLAARGFQKAQRGNADLVLHYHASVTQELDVANIDRGIGSCPNCPSPSVYEAGTIMLDLVDAKSNTLVWRGWVEGSFEGMIDNQAWLEQRVDEAVTRIVKTVPHTF